MPPAEFYINEELTCDDNYAPSAGECGMHNFHYLSVLTRYCISMHSQANIIHGFIPDNMLMSTLVPIPEGSNSESESDNYRAIALCGLFLKIFEYCLLISNKDKMLVSNLQFAFKVDHSTSQCT